MTWLDLLALTFKKLCESWSGFAPYVGLILLGIVWIAWWLAGVNWKKFWPALAKGAWLPLLLLAIVAALVWTQLQPGDCHCWRFMTMPNGWWQTGTVALLVATALLCGWLQGVWHCTPHEISVEPPAHGAGHQHGPGHH